MGHWQILVVIIVAIYSARPKGAFLLSRIHQLVFVVSHLMLDKRTICLTPPSTLPWSSAAILLLDMSNEANVIFLVLILFPVLVLEWTESAQSCSFRFLLPLLLSCWIKQEQLTSTLIALLIWSLNIIPCVLLALHALFEWTSALIWATFPPAEIRNVFWLTICEKKLIFSTLLNVFCSVDTWSLSAGSYLLAEAKPLLATG